MQVKDDLEGKVRSVQSLIQGMAKNLARDVYGPQGFPAHTEFEQIEELGLQLGNAITREFIQQAMVEQAQQLEGQEHSCPTCGGSTEHRSLAPHLLETQRGEVAWKEPERYCSACRRAFFPSVP